MRVMTWDTGNFGDRLNDYVWSRVCPEILSNNEDDDLLVGIGSLLNHRLPRERTKYICGSGVGHGDMSYMDASWVILWVRGPVTTELLGIDANCAIADGALLMRDMINLEPADKSHVCAFMPHVSAIRAGTSDVLRDVCQECGLHFINPLDSVESVVDQISKSEKLITEALHGSIIADLLRVPWIPVARCGVLALKWRDWCGSVGLEYRPTSITYRPQWHAPERSTKLTRRLLFPVLRPVSRRLLCNQLIGM